MKVKLLTSRATELASQDAGEVVDMPEDEAQRYVQAGMAEHVQATKQAPENAMLNRAGRPR